MKTTTSVIFRNQGLIDLRAIKTFGASSKETDSPIGFFGTGLKYAIAILLREHQKVTIFRGKTKLEFTSKKTKIRVDHFSIVCMNGQELGFTTELGKNWELWQAYRELHCNCVDEKGNSSLVENPSMQSLRLAGHTTVQVTGKKFLEVFERRGDVILQSSALLVTKNVEIHRGATNNIYFRGILVGTHQHKASHTYNILGNLALTEDRTVRYPWEVSSYIRAAILESTDSGFIRCCLKAEEDTLENRLDYTESLSIPPSDEFKEVALSLTRDYSNNTNRSAVRICKDRIRKELTDHVAGVMSPLMQKQLTKAKAFCIEIGFAIDDYPIIVIDSLGKNILGLAENKKIFLSQDVFELGTKMIAGTLIEEFLHLDKHFYDCSRAFQDYLLNKIVTLGERLNGEPL